VFRFPIGKEQNKDRFPTVRTFLTASLTVLPRNQKNVADGTALVGLVGGVLSHDLAGVEDVLGINAALDGTHQLDGLGSLFHSQPFLSRKNTDEICHNTPDTTCECYLLAAADAMLASTGAFHGDGTLHQSVVESVGFLHLRHGCR
jgi:hypothetical protein